MPVMTSIQLSVPFIKKGIANLGISVRSSIRRKLVANQTNGIILWWSPKHWITLPSRGEHHFADIHCEGRPSARNVSDSSEIIQQGGQSSRSPNALPYEQLGNGADLIETNMEFACNNAWDPHNNTTQVTRTYIQACDNSSDLSTGHLKGMLSHLGQIANMKIENLLWTAAHLFT